MRFSLELKKLIDQIGLNAHAFSRMTFKKRSEQLCSTCIQFLQG